ncbi:helix-turn-helix domain-containing protein [Vibrio albus]|uniref:helix-turn-helix domain-containing protein n=1 Tax=Vibrio albus TaxID=2200953 RepID=UPI002481C770|nr:helix-turn-helix transcriptional regulator [Vibrio albus]
MVFIRRILRDRGISYSRLSEMTEIDESKLKRVLSGRQPMTLEMCDNLAVALSLNEVDSCGLGNSASEFLLLWEQLEPELKSSILSLVRAVAKVKS